MTKEQLIQIAKVGFPDRVKQFINFDNAEIHHMSGVYRLYDKDTPFVVVLPKHEHISVFIDKDEELGFVVQITTGNKAFNHYAAIKEMEKMKLIR